MARIEQTISAKRKMPIISFPFLFLFLSFFYFSSYCLSFDFFILSTFPIP